MAEEFADVVMKCYTTDCPPGKGFTRGFSGGGKCSSCVAGETWNSETDDKLCAPVTATCPPGEGYQRSTSKIGDSTCTICEEGTFSAGDDDGDCEAHTVMSCGAGEELTAGSAHRDGECSPCPATTYKSEAGAKPCKPHTLLSCEAGHEALEGTATTNGECVACESGEFSTGGGSACEPHGTVACAVGFGKVAGSSTADHSCEACGAGQFSADVDDGSCHPHTAAPIMCQAGQQSATGSATIDTHCADCPEGKFKEAAGEESCSKIVCTPARISHPEVAVFNQRGLNGGGVGDQSDENANLLSIMENRMAQHHEGYRINTEITSFNIPNLKSKLATSTFFIMTDMESGNPRDASFLPSSAKKVLRDFVADGGVILLTATGGDNDNAFMNEIFGWDTTQRSLGSQSLNAANAKGTSFQGGPVSGKCSWRY